jgi:hypothetical protein
MHASAAHCSEIAAKCDAVVAVFARDARTGDFVFRARSEVRRNDHNPEFDTVFSLSLDGELTAGSAELQLRVFDSVATTAKPLPPVASLAVAAAVGGGGSVGVAHYVPPASHKLLGCVTVAVADVVASPLCNVEYALQNRLDARQVGSIFSPFEFCKAFTVTLARFCQPLLALLPDTTHPLFRFPFLPYQAVCNQQSGATVCVVTYATKHSLIYYVISIVHLTRRCAISRAAPPCTCAPASSLSASHSLTKSAMVSSASCLKPCVLNLFVLHYHIMRTHEPQEY